MVAAKPDCTGQKFGMLTVLGKGSRVLYRKSNGSKSYKFLWLLVCDCGKKIELARGDFDRRIGRGQVSCGCKQKRGLVDNKRRPHNITGFKFGTLTAIELTGIHDKERKPTWLMQCDCGNSCEKSLSNVRRREYKGIRINCGDRSKHPEKYLTYPSTPNPYPKEAGELLVKYLPLTELDYQQINSAVEDEKRDRLIRAAWILTYRRQQGEEISELHESRTIKKYLRYCSIAVFWQRKLEEKGGLLYDVCSNKKAASSPDFQKSSDVCGCEFDGGILPPSTRAGSFPRKARAGECRLEIGNTMTNLTSNDYPAIETQGIKPLLSCRKLRFKRC